MRLARKRMQGPSAMIGGIRDLFAAAWLGEQLFAHVGMRRGLKAIDDPMERNRVAREAWRCYRAAGIPIAAGVVGFSLAGLIVKKPESAWEWAAPSLALGAAAVAVTEAFLARGMAPARPEPKAPAAYKALPQALAPIRRAQVGMKVVAPIGIALGVLSVGSSIASRMHKGALRT